MTFTQEDVSGIKMYYQDEEENKNEENWCSG
jgi:hypothetical protein